MGCSHMRPTGAASDNFYPLSAAHLCSIFDKVSDGAFVVDRNLKIIGFNSSAESLTGFLRREAMGRTCTDVLRNRNCGHHCQISGTKECAIHRALETGADISNEDVEVQTHDGRRRIFSVSAIPLSGPNTNHVAVAVIFRDVTELRHLHDELRGRYELQNLVGKSAPMREVYRLVELAAESGASVLLEGESGTGKELVATTIHYMSHRAKRRFVRVNCSAVPETLLESELFGHVKGAFTGAIRDKIGRFQLADGGTLLLDEIGEISPLIQLKLLRFAEEKVFERVGDVTPLHVDVRIISATNKDLKQLVSEGRFREDLYYRLRVLPIFLPPLRERKDDLVLLVRHFVELLRNRTQKLIEGPDEQALAALVDYPWPGNVRELENAVEHAFVRCSSDRFSIEDLPAEIRNPGEATRELIRHGAYASRRPRRQLPPPDPENEKQTILRVLEMTDDNRSQAAEILGISRTTLWRKMKGYGLLEQAGTQYKGRKPGK